MANENNQQAQTPAKKTIMQKQQDVKDRIIQIIQQNEAEGGHYPKNYSAANAMNGAWLFLTMAKDKDGNPVLEVCTPESVMKALLKMLTNGLNVLKDQCYLIAYNGELSCDISRYGKELMAKRAGIVKVRTRAIYEKDEFSFEIDSDTGVTRILEHKSSLESIGDGTKIKGAWAKVEFEDGTQETTVMTKDQIVMAWNQRKGNGLTPAHQKFTDEMARKTVSNRAVKPYINSSDDSALEGIGSNPSKPIEAQKPESFDFHEVVEPKAAAIEAPKENPLNSLKQEKPEPVMAGHLFDQAVGQASNGVAAGAGGPGF